MPTSATLVLTISADAEVDETVWSTRRVSRGWTTARERLPDTPPQPKPMAIALRTVRLSATDFASVAFAAAISAASASAAASMASASKVATLA